MMANFVLIYTGGGMPETEAEIGRQTASARVLPST